MNINDNRTEKEYLFNILSDLFKDVNGTRPRHYRFDDMTEDDINEELDHLQEQLVVVQDAQAKQEAEAVVFFKSVLDIVIKSGAKDEDTALRWLIESEDPNWFDPEQWVWEHGILFTDYGRNLVKRIGEVV